MDIVAQHRVSSLELCGLVPGGRLFACAVLDITSNGLLQHLRGDSFFFITNRRGANNNKPLNGFCVFILSFFLFHQRFGPRLAFNVAADVSQFLLNY